jgi:hypothetical protein
MVCLISSNKPGFINSITLSTVRGPYYNCIAYPSTNIHVKICIII